jgi:hypothetical protein
MASSLSKSTQFMRKVLIAFIIFAILSFGYQFANDYINNQNNIPPEQISQNNNAYAIPNNKFEQIPRFEIISKTLAPETRATFSIASNNRLPNFPNSVNVYKINPPRERLGDVNRARTIATKLGFNFEENSNENNTLVWNSSDLTKVLYYHKVEQEWKFEVLLNRSSILSNQLIIDSNPNFYSSFATKTIDSLGISRTRFAGSNSRVIYSTVKNGVNIRQAESFRTANSVMVSLYRSIIASELSENYRPQEGTTPATNYIADVIKLDYRNGVADFIITNNKEDIEKDLLAFNFKDFEYGEKAIYNLITAESAWNLIQQNKGYLIWLKLDNDDFFNEHAQLNVKEFKADSPKTRLIYLEPDKRIAELEYTHYLQPFYLFEGTVIVADGRQGKFIFLVPALEENSYR